MTNPKVAHTWEGDGFGPGSLESLVLHGRFLQSGMTQYRLEGSYAVFCGNGNRHDVDIDSAWFDESGRPDGVFSDEDRASNILEVELDGWFDPCEAAIEKAERMAEDQSYQHRATR
jgi:hypothetical protein